MNRPAPAAEFAGVRHGALSDVGRRRTKNEDSYLVLEIPPEAACPAGPRALFAVADGIGGHTAGDVASRLACERLSSLFFRISRTLLPGLSAGALRRALVRAFFAIDERIGDLAGGEGEYAHMGTTLTALALTAEHGVVVHAGDSRIYRFRGKRLVKLTTDHTFVQDLISYGELTEKEAAVHPFRHMLTGAVGTREPLEAVFADTFWLREGDRFLLCTDGLHDMLDHGEMERIMGGGGAQRIAAALVRAANDRGGKDNVTAVVVDI